MTKHDSDDSKIKHFCSDFMENKIKSCRGVQQYNDGVNGLEKEKQRENFRTILDFKEHDIMKVTEKTTLDSIKNAFEGENIQTHYRILGYEIDIYYELAVEIDKYNHEDRDIGYEIERQQALEKELGCKFIRINPDKENFNVFKAINEIFRHIKESNKKLTEESTKKSLVDELSNKLLRLEFKSDNSIKTKCLKYVVKNILPNYKTNMLIYCLKCEKNTKKIDAKMMKTKNG